MDKGIFTAFYGNFRKMPKKNAKKKCQKKFPKKHEIFYVVFSKWTKILGDELFRRFSYLSHEKSLSFWEKWRFCPKKSPKIEPSLKKWFC